MTVQELKNEVYSYEKPKNWRDGQFVFNMVNELYGVARIVQFCCGVDCYYDDSKIDEFLIRSVEMLNWGEGIKPTKTLNIGEVNGNMTINM